MRGVFLLIHCSLDGILVHKATPAACQLTVCKRERYTRACWLLNTVLTPRSVLNCSLLQNVSKTTRGRKMSFNFFFFERKPQFQNSSVSRSGRISRYIAY